MSLIDMITGNSNPSPGARTGFSLNLMDRIVNPATMAGAAMMGGQDPMAAANMAETFAQKRQQNEALKYFAASLPPEERAIAMMAPSQYVAARMAKLNEKPFAVGRDGSVYDPSTNTFSRADASTDKKFTPGDMRKEYDYSRYTPESVEAAEAAGDPKLLVPGGPAVNEGKLKSLEYAQGNVEKRLAPIRQGMLSIQLANKLLEGKGGPSDYGALVSFVKSTDPGTAAREGEVSAASAAQGYLNMIGEIAQKAEGNGFLTNEQKIQMREALNGMAGIYKDNYDHVVSHYGGKYSKTFDLDPDLVVGSPINFGTSNAPLDNTPTPTLPHAAGTFVKGALGAIGLGGDGPKPAEAQPAMKFEVIDGKMTRVK